jgi:hypothetical protein
VVNILSPNQRKLDKVQGNIRNMLQHPVMGQGSVIVVKVGKHRLDPSMGSFFMPWCHGAYKSLKRLVGAYRGGKKFKKRSEIGL